MKIYNFRDMFACNSSSTHSLVITPDAYSDKDSYGYFGWNNFVCATKQSKMEYFLCQLAENLGDIIPSQYIKDIIFSRYNHKFNEDDDGYGVDHQSKIIIPSVKETYWDDYLTLNEEFVKDLEEFILRDDVVVFGGNDNDDTQFELSSKEKVFDFKTDGSSRSYKARKDGDVWVLMNRETGWKTRFSFKDNAIESYTKASKPELVDIKIISTCRNAQQRYPADCARFCYQSSTANGKHVSLDDFKNIVNILEDYGVMEVALGGGEPFDHPDIINILQACKDRDIIPNITTRNYDWLDDEKKANQVFSMVGQVAFSVSSKTDILQVAFFRNKYHRYHSKFVCQYVCETQSRHSFESVIDTAKSLDIRLIFLGFKEVGNGIKFKTHDYNKAYADYNVVEVLHKMKYNWYGVDTTFIQKYEDSLKKLNVSPTLYYCEEGAFSFYIDAVENTISKSSYDSETFSLNGINNKKEFILEKYKEW